MLCIQQHFLYMPVIFVYFKFLLSLLFQNIHSKKLENFTLTIMERVHVEATSCLLDETVALWNNITIISHSHFLLLFVKIYLPSTTYWAPISTMTRPLIMGHKIDYHTWQFCSVATQRPPTLYTKVYMYITLFPTIR